MKLRLHQFLSKTGVFSSKAEEKQAMKEFGSSDSGASLGDILGAALAKRGGDEDK